MKTQLLKIERSMLFLFIFILTSLSFASAAEFSSSELTNNFGLVEFQISKKTFLSAVPLLITVTPNTIKVGDHVTVLTGLEADCPYNHKFTVDVSIANAQTYSKSFGFELACQSSYELQLGFDTIKTPGTYTVKYNAKDTTTQTVFKTESTSLTVQAQPVAPAQCTSQSRWADWSSQQTYNANGNIQERYYIEVDDKCQEKSTKLEQRTTCNAGFYIDGDKSKGSAASGFHSCEQEKQTSHNYLIIGLMAVIGISIVWAGFYFFGVIAGTSAVILILIISLVSASGGASYLSSGFGGKSNVVCQVNIKNDFGFKPKIDTFSCIKESSCLLSISNPLSLFSNTDTLVMNLGGDTAKQTITTGEFSSQQASLNVCTKNTDGTLELKDEQNNVIDSKSIKI